MMHVCRQAGPHASSLPAAMFRRRLEGICQKKKSNSEIFCPSFLGYSKFSLMLVEGKHQTEKSLQLINCCAGVIGSLATQLLNCLQGLGLNAKKLNMSFLITLW